MPTQIIIPPKQQLAASLVRALALSGVVDPRDLKAAVVEENERNNRAFLDSLPTGRHMSRVAFAESARLPPRSLPGIGVALVDGLSPEGYEHCRRVGAQVFPNLMYRVVPPVDVVPQAARDAWHLDRIEAAVPRARGLTGRGVRVGLLDTGIDANHPEFADTDVRFREFDAHGFPVESAPHDTASHGTHVSALVAGRSCGVAPGASLAVAAVLTNGGAGTSAQILAGLDWLVRGDLPGDDVKVLGASLGTDGHSGHFLSPLLSAFHAPGLLTVAAIGNSGFLGQNHHGSPGDYDFVLGVGASDRNDAVAPFSDWGNQSGGAKPNLCAPGVGVVGAVPGGYAAMSGATMAASLVSAAAALLIERSPELYGVPRRLFNELIRLTAPLGDPRGGAGRLDLSSLGV